MSQKMPCKASLNINAHFPCPFQLESLKLFTWTLRAELWFQFQMWNKQKPVCIWKQSVILSCRTSQIGLHKGKLSYRNCVECEHGKLEPIINLTLITTSYFMAQVNTPLLQIHWQCIWSYLLKEDNSML